MGAVCGLYRHTLFLDRSPKAEALSGQVLFVVGNTTLNAGDAAVRNRLQALGLAVTTVDDGVSQAGDATGKQLVVISSTVNSADVNTKYRNTAVPVLTWEPRILDDLGMTGLTLGIDYSTTASQTQIVMAATTHQLAAGLSGTVSVSTSVQSVAWGKPGTTAIKIAQVVGDPAKASIFAYNSGTSMVNLTAPARRTALFPSDNTAASFTINGWKLFDAAVQWTLEGSGTPLPGTSIKYNFQPSASAIPSGYLSDIGQAYNGTRGWVMQNSLQNPSATPLDMRAQTRDRKVAGVDQRLNTLIALQLTSTALGAWEYNLANGPYTVTASVGDPSYIDSKYRINMEGGIAINNFIPTSSNKFFSLSHLVYVNDGKLTLDAIGGTNTKLNYVEISNASAAASRPAVTTTNPKNGATNVSVTSAITADVHIPTSGAGVNQNTLSPSTVKLIRLSNNVQVAANLNTSGGGDVIVAQPTAPLAPLTEYFFQVTSGVKDLAGAAFIPYAIRFTTGNTTSTGPTR